MPNEEEAREAIEHLNDISLGKKPLVVKEADERNSPPGNPGGGQPRGGGDFRGGGSGPSSGNKRSNPKRRLY